MVVTARNKRWQDTDKRGTSLDRLARHFEALSLSVIASGFCKKNSPGPDTATERAGPNPSHFSMRLLVSRLWMGGRMSAGNGSRQPRGGTCKGGSA